MGDWLKCRNRFDNLLVDPLVVIVAVAAVFYIVHVISSLLTEQPVTLCTCDVESLLAPRLVTLHTRPMLGPRLPPRLLAEVAHLRVHLIVSFLWH